MGYKFFSRIWLFVALVGSVVHDVIALNSTVLSVLTPSLTIPLMSTPSKSISSMQLRLSTPSMPLSLMSGSLMQSSTSLASPSIILTPAMLTTSMQRPISIFSMASSLTSTSSKPLITVSTNATQMPVPTSSTFSSSVLSSSMQMSIATSSLPPSLVTKTSMPHSSVSASPMQMPMHTSSVSTSLKVKSSTPMSASTMSPSTKSTALMPSPLMTSPLMTTNSVANPLMSTSLDTSISSKSTEITGLTTYLAVSLQNANLSTKTVSPVLSTAALIGTRKVSSVTGQITNSATPSTTTVGGLNTLSSSNVSSTRGQASASIIMLHEESAISSSLLVEVQRTQGGQSSIIGATSSAQSPVVSQTHTSSSQSSLDVKASSHTSAASEGPPTSSSSPVRDAAQSSYIKPVSGSSPTPAPSAAGSVPSSPFPSASPSHSPSPSSSPPESASPSASLSQSPFPFQSPSAASPVSPSPLAAASVPSSPSPSASLSQPVSSSASVPSSPSPSASVPSSPSPSASVPSSPSPSAAVPSSPSPSAAVPSSPSPSAAVPSSPSPSAAVPSSPSPSASVSSSPSSSASVPSSPSPSASLSPTFALSPASSSVPLSPSPSTSLSQPASSSKSVAPSPSPSPTPGSNREFYCKITVVGSCTNGIQSNLPSSSDYQAMKKKVEQGCIATFNTTVTFKRCIVERFTCGSVVSHLKITMDSTAPSDAATALQPLSQAVTSNSVPGLDVKTNSFEASTKPFSRVEPNIYATVRFSLSNTQFCRSVNDFQVNLAKRVMKPDGTGAISSTQVILFENECRNLAAAGTSLAEPKFFISTKNNLNTPDVELTTRAVKLLRQYIKDGTTSRLGAAFDGKVKEVVYGGKDAPKDDKLSDVAIVFIAIGATVGFLLFIILIILICRKIRQSEKSQSEKSYQMKVNNPTYVEDGNTVPFSADNPTLVVDEIGEKTEPEKVKIEENEYEYPTAPANGSAPRNGVTKAEINSNHNGGYQELEPVNQQAEPVTESTVSPPSYEALTEASPEPKAEPETFIVFSEEPTREVPKPVEVTIAETEPVEVTIAETEPVEVESTPPAVDLPPQPELIVVPETEPLQESAPEPPPEPSPEPTPKPAFEPVTVILPTPAPIPEGKELSFEELALRKSDDDWLRKEFESLECNIPDSSIYPPAVIEKNRFPNSVPRPESRVILPTLPMVIHSDYINANYVRDQSGKKAYIATQGPLQSTAADFWRMVWDQNAAVIVMVTPLVQMGTEKCFQYWPPDSISRKYGEIEVQLKKKELRPNFTVTTMSVKSEGGVRDVILYRFMTWPEDNIPENMKSTITFLLEVRKSAKAIESDLVIVHCSDGVGVSGAFITIDQGMRSLEENKSVDISSLVRSIRKDRAGAVQTFEQYKFIYRALYEYAVYLGANQTDELLKSSITNEAEVTSKM